MCVLCVVYNVTLHNIYKQTTVNPQGYQDSIYTITKTHTDTDTPLKYTQTDIGSTGRHRETQRDTDTHTTKIHTARH